MNFICYIILVHTYIYTHHFLNTPRYYLQKMDIPTMETGCEVAKRAYKELTDIQVCVHSSVYYYNYQVP